MNFVGKHGNIRSITSVWIKKTGIGWNVTKKFTCNFWSKGKKSEGVGEGFVLRNKHFLIFEANWD